LAYGAELDALERSMRDSDESRVVSAEELLAWFQRSDNALRPEQLAGVLDACDFDRTAKIREAEILHLLLELRMIQAEFHRLDVSPRDGVVSLTELAAGNALTVELFDQFANENGRLTFHEFAQAYAVHHRSRLTASSTVSSAAQGGGGEDALSVWSKAFARAGFLDETIVVPHTSYVTEHPVALQMLIGGTAAAGASSVTHPIDILRVRMQMHRRGAQEKLHAQRRMGLLGTARRIVQTEGVWAFRSGVRAAILHAYAFTGTRLALFEPCREALANFNLHQTDPQDHRIAVSVIAALGSGAAAALVANGIELVKTRQQANANRYTSFVHALRSITTHEGAAVLLNGAVPHMLRGAVLTASQIALYDEVTAKLVWLRVAQADSIALKVGVALVAGLVSTTTASPFDVVKTRCMTTNVSSLDAARNVLKVDGISGFWKGGTASFSRLGPQTLLVLLLYDQLNQMVDSFK
jgi:hypothetical protein